MLSNSQLIKCTNDHGNYYFIQLNSFILFNSLINVEYLKLTNNNINNPYCI